MAQPAYLQAELRNARSEWCTWFVFIWSCCSVER